MSLLSTVVLEAQLPCTPCTLWRLKYHVVTIHASTVLQRLQVVLSDVVTLVSYNQVKAVKWRMLWQR